MSNELTSVGSQTWARATGEVLESFEGSPPDPETAGSAADHTPTSTASGTTRPGFISLSALQQLLRSCTAEAKPQLYPYLPFDTSTIFTHPLPAAPCTL